LNKIVSTKVTTSIFLVIVLVAGTFAAVSPSFMVRAQAEPYLEMDTKYGSYEPEPEYANNNIYEPQYPSYKPDYKAKYQSDNKYKSKDSNVSINKLKCINANLNINGNNTGNVNISNKGQGYAGANSYGGNYDGYGNKQGKGFNCEINNNNTNTNININISVGGGNQTIPPVENECIECFKKFLTPAQFEDLESTINSGIHFIDNVSGFQINLESLEELCELLKFLPAPRNVLSTIIFNIVQLDIDQDTFEDIFLCVAEATGIETSIRLVESADSDVSTISLDNNTDTSSSNINTAGSLIASSFSSPPTIAEGAEEDLSALEKVAKLKQQWLDLLP